MWAKRFEKEDVKAKEAKMAEEENAAKEMIEKEARTKAEELVRAHKQKIIGRLEVLNWTLGLTDVRE